MCCDFGLLTVMLRMFCKASVPALGLARLSSACGGYEWKLFLGVSSMWLFVAARKQILRKLMAGRQKSLEQTGDPASEGEDEDEDEGPL